MAVSIDPSVQPFGDPTGRGAPPEPTWEEAMIPTWSDGGEGTLLAVGIDEHQVRGALLENIAGSHRLAAWYVLPRQGERHLGDQVAGLCRQLGQQLGRRLWDEREQMPLLMGRDPLRHPPLSQLALTLSPRPALRVWIAALTQGYSAEAARLAVAGSSAQVVGQTLLAVDTGIADLIAGINAQRPDVIVLTGGFDANGPAAIQPLQWLATVLAGALQRLPRRARPAVFFAGNRWAATPVETILQGADAIVATVPNIMPNPHVIRQDALGNALEEYYWRLCRKLDGFALLERWHTLPSAITTVESNFMRLVQTWMALHNLPALHGLYCGDRWLHVWATEEQPGLAVLYTDPDPAHFRPPGWPPVQLLSGAWPDRTPLPADVRWWDSLGLAPIVAALGPGAPGAVYSALRQDLLQEVG